TLLAWTLFALCRLVLFGETADNLPIEDGALAERHHAMKASVLLYLVFLACKAVAVYFTVRLSHDVLETALKAGATPETLQVPPETSLALMVLLFLTLWGLRLTVMNIPAAAD